jgi:hypothetical protein
MVIVHDNGEHAHAQPALSQVIHEGEENLAKPPPENVEAADYVDDLMSDKEEPTAAL